MNGKSLFDPDTVSLMRRAVESAWTSLPEPRGTADTKAMMARAVTIAANRGMLEPTQLTSIASEAGRHRAS